MKYLIILLAVFLSATHVFGQEPVWSKKYHTGSVTCLDFSGDGKMLASGSNDYTLRLWNIDTGEVTKIYNFNKDVPSSFTFINSKGRIVGLKLRLSQGFAIPSSFNINLTEDTISSGFPIRLWREGEDGSPMAAIDLSSAKYTFANLINDSTVFYGISSNLSGSATFLRITGEAGFIFKRSINSDSLVTPHPLTAAYTTILLSHEKSKYFGSGIYNVHYSGQKQGHQYDYGPYSVGSVISDINTGKNTSFEIIDKEVVEKAAFLEDDTHIAVARKNGEIIVFTDEGKYQSTLSRGTSLVTALATNKLGHYIISTHTDSTLRLWTPGIPNIFKRILLKSPVTTIAVSPDSVHFATAHTDGTVALWNIDSLALKAAVDSVFTPGIDSISPDQILCKGTDAEFTVSARSNFGEELSYRWQKGGVDIMASDSASGVTSATLLLKSIDKGDAGNYSVVVASLKNSSITSPFSVLSVREVPVITVQLNTKTELYKGEKIVLKITLADTAGLQYQWFKNGEPIAGAVSAAYTVTADSGSVAGSYTVRITNQCGSVMSDEAEIAVLTTDIAEEAPFKNTQLSAEPNPFKNFTTIRFSLPHSLQIKLVVTDILGKEIAVVEDNFKEAGEYTAVFKSDGIPEGTYFITLSGDGLLKTIPVKIIR